MLRTFLFVLSLLTDYRAVSEALHTGVIWGAVNTGMFLGALICASLRRLFSGQGSR
jgi:hypothetical protein